MTPQRQEIWNLMAKYANMLALSGGTVLDVGIAGDPVMEGAKSRSEKYQWFGKDNNFETLDNDLDWEPDTIGDICHAPYPVDNFDLVILSETLEHIYDFKLALKECYRILKPQGHLIITTPWLIDHHPTSFTPDYWRFSKQVYEKLMPELGFTIKDQFSSQYINGVLCQSQEKSKNLAQNVNSAD